jgi:hypothetical protein
MDIDSPLSITICPICKMDNYFCTLICEICEIVSPATTDDES